MEIFLDKRAVRQIRLSAQDAIEEGKTMGVGAESSLNYAATPDGTREAMSSTSATMRRMRRGESRSLEYTQDERRRSAG